MKLYNILYFLNILKHSIGGNGDVAPIRIGNSRDDNNCLISAGYSWCESSNSCIRMWETPCEDNYSNCGDCLRRQRNGENIACPMNCDMEIVSCENDEECGTSYFCRQTTMNYDGPKECVLYSKEGDSCGGYTLPSHQTRCLPPLECANTMGPMIADAPGNCIHPCIPPNVRDSYGNCNKPQNIMIPEPILEGVFNCDEACPPRIPCPAPGPDCEYLQPIPDNCGCVTSCGEIYCNLIDPPLYLPTSPPNICSEVMCMMYCEYGHQKDENGCDICACNEVNNPECPIPYEDCNDLVCPKVIEITHCSENGIQGFTTYRLSLVLNSNDIQNVYAIFGSVDDSHIMTIPPAYQIDTVFGSNIGGIPDSIISVNPDSEFDSWLTIEVTDGDSDNKLSTIGIDFKSWNINTALEIQNGAVFKMNPNELLISNTNEVVVGQLTIPSSINERVVINAQGKLMNNRVWKQNNIVFLLNPPINTQNNIPLNCDVWFDGCNTCQVSNGVLGACTRMMCFREDEPSCLRLIDGH